MSHPQNENVIYQAVLSGELEIDDLGRIWRVKKRTWDRHTTGVRTTPCKRVRAEFRNRDGYLLVRIMRDGKSYGGAAHRLVWRHFNGPIPDGLTVNHKCGNKEDNRPGELELATYSEQRRHALTTLGVKTWQPKGSRHPKTKIDEAIVVEMRRLRSEGTRVIDIAARYHMYPKAVSAICCRRTWTHVP